MQKFLNFRSSENLIVSIIIYTDAKISEFPKFRKFEHSSVIIVIPMHNTFMSNLRWRVIESNMTLLDRCKPEEDIREINIYAIWFL